jgi:hypothetical protein
MSLALREFITSVDSVRQSIRACRSAQLGSAKRRREVQTMVDRYFTSVRTELARNEEQTDALRSIDSKFQEILSLSHSSALVAKYSRLLKAVRGDLVKLDSSSRTPPTAVGSNVVSRTDQQIIETLKRVVPSAALSYTQALTDLIADSRLSWRGPATDLREALRETLDHLAPDKEVIDGDGFKLETGASGPTMKQKVRYILKKRGISKTLASTPELAAESVETAVGSFIRSVYTRSSVSTHTPTEKDEVLRVRDWVRVTLCELLEVRE